MGVEAMTGGVLDCCTLGTGDAGVLIDLKSSDSPAGVLRETVTRLGLMKLLPVGCPTVEPLGVGGGPAALTGPWTPVLEAGRSEICELPRDID